MYNAICEVIRMAEFTDYEFKQFIYDTIDFMNFKRPTSIQKKVIPYALKGQDIIGISQTGTGKTHAFLLPIMQSLNLDIEQVQAVIMAPTRELAGQIYDNVRYFQKFEPRIKVSLLIGGDDKKKAISKLETQPHIVVGTPGRIKDLSLDEQALKITTASVMVIDEADMALEFGYLEDIDAVAGKMKDDLQMMVYSATIPNSMIPFLKKYMKNPITIQINPNEKTNTNIEHYLIDTKHNDRYDVLRKIMNSITPYICIIFCNTRTYAAEIAKRLLDEGIRVGVIHGDLEPRERRQMMRRIQNMDYQYIVATDIAARGIDIDGVSHVISMEFPSELDFYIHRSGRCGRNEYTGVCYSLYDHDDEAVVKQLEERGIEFKTLNIKTQGLVAGKQREQRQKREKHITQLEIEARRKIPKKTKVKPGYKKKRQWEVDKIVRKQKRALIRQDIQRQKKERARKKQRELNGYSED